MERGISRRESSQAIHTGHFKEYARKNYSKHSSKFQLEFSTVNIKIGIKRIRYLITYSTTELHILTAESLKVYNFGFIFKNLF